MRFIPYEKMSKKSKKELNDKKRKTWDMINPATKVAETNKKLYKRHSKHKPNYIQY